MEKIGIIAGNKRFPLLLAEAAKRKGYYIVAVGIKGDTSARLKKFTDKMYWLDLGQFQRLPDIFNKEGVVNVVMAGQVSPWRLFSRQVESNPVIQELLSGAQDRRADTIFRAIAGRLKEKGINLLDSTLFLAEHLAQKGVLSRIEPGFGVWDDIYFGFNIAKEIAGLDIGQTVAVKDKAIVAVEALEGTDNLIRRAGLITRGGFTVVKVSKPRQDARFDIPVVGPGTVKNLISSGAKCLAVEADKTLFLDREKAVALADNKGIAVVAV